MEAINQRLIDEAVDVEARPMRGWMMVQRDLQVAIPMPGPDAERIFAWFKNLYGDRLLTDFSMGRVLVMLRGDAWAMQIPRSVGAPAPLPFIRVIEKISEAFIRSLTADEIAHLRLVAQEAMRSFAAVEKKLAFEVQADWKTAVDQAVANRHSYGHSKWSSQQAVEKALNAYITKNGGKNAATSDSRIPRAFA